MSAKRILGLVSCTALSIAFALVAHAQEDPGTSGELGRAICPVIPRLDALNGADGPMEMGRRGTDYFVKNQLRRGIQDYGGDGYAWTFGYVGSLRFTLETGDTAKNRGMLGMLSCGAYEGPSNKPDGRESVDNRAFGGLPLEIFLQNGDTTCKALGMSRADAQYDNKGADGLPVDVRYWIDDMYMITSLQVWAYRATRQQKYLDLAARTMIAYIDALQKDNPGAKVSGLFWHTRKSHAYWSRANGWFAAGATELLLELPAGPDRDRVMAAWKKQMDALVSDLQFPSGPDQGCWHQVLDVTTDPRSFAETSSTAMFTYALVTGLKNGWIAGERYVEAAVDGWTCIANKTDRTGLLTNVCEGTGEPTATDLAGQQEFYFERRTPPNDRHGQGPLLWAATALLRKDCPGMR